MRPLQLLSAFIAALLFASACSDDPEPTNKCADVQCESGTCDPGTGECVNPGTCEDPSDCLEGFVCEDSQCVEAAANDCRIDSCERGECNTNTGECVNAGSCTAGSEEVRCLEDFRCVSAVCVNETTFCEDLDCQRGECSFAVLSCVDAATCEGDTDCLSGNYCADGTCEVNTCDANMVDCPRGVCDAETGECANPATCAAAADCLDANLCVGGTCLDENDACDCPGNQVCEYDGTTLSVSCELNPAGCANALDCKGADICVDGACQAPAACEADAFEPNDTVETTVNYQTSEDQGSIRNLTLCESDVDRFVFDTREDEEDLGTLRVEANIPPNAVGQGIITMTLFGPNGAEVATAQNVDNGVTTGRVRIDRQITNLSRGEYTVVLDGSDLSLAGVPYSLTMDILNAEIINACSTPALLVEGQTVNSISTSGASVSLGTQCGVAADTVPEDIYTIVLDREGYVNVLAVPQPLVDISVGLRRECASDTSEFVCANDEPSGGIETLGAFLDPGTYFVVVQGAAAGGGGAYALSYNVEEVVCTPNSSQCVDANTVEACNPNGTGTAQLPCSEGCDAASGRCIRIEGDACERPFVVSSFPFSTEVTWDDFQNDYEAGAGTCLSQNSVSETDGSDAVFQVTLPPGEAIVADLARGSSYVSMYLSTDCTDLVDACVAGANRTQFANEELIFLNETAQDQTYFLVVDRGATSPTSNPSSTLNLQKRAIICVPDSTQCVLNRESQICNSLGTAYDQTVFCEFGCDQGTGECQTPPNNTCSGAETLVPDTTIVGDIAPYTDENRTGTCPATGSSSSGFGRDAVYVMNLDVADIVTVNVSANYNVMLWVSDGCVGDSLNTCITRVNQTSSSTSDSETMQFVANTAGDYYIVVDTVSSATSSGTFTLSATVSAASCIPGETFGCNAAGTAIEYCTELGVVGEYSCDGGCTAGACANPQGDICADVIPLVGTAGSESHSFSGAIREHAVPSAGTYGECQLSSAPGFDRMFRVDLNAGEIFRMNLTSTSSFARYYAVRDCGDINTCFGIPASGDDDFSYFASQPETFYIVVQYGLSSSSTLSYTMDWEIESTNFLCLPSSSVCADPTTVEVCGADGISSELITCPGGCVAGACETAVTADTCSGAVNVGSGYRFTFDPADFADDNSFSSLYCGGGTTPGRDAFFEVNLLADEVLTVSADHASSSHYAVISLFSGCSDPAGSCLVFDRGEFSDPSATISYQAKTAETILISVDATSSSATSRVSGVIEVSDAECTSGPSICNVDGDTLISCRNGQILETPCDGACANGECASPEGDSCFDAIPLDRAQTSSVSSSFQGTNFAQNYTAGYVNQCVVGYIYNGIDVYYSLDLLQGERLQAEATGLSSAYLFLLEGCDYDSCLDHEPINRRTIDYVADQDKTVFLVLDRSLTSTSASTAAIDYTITPNQVCVPGKFECIDANTAQRCGVDGAGVAGPTYACPWGCDSDIGRCRVDVTSNIDSCSTAPVIVDNFAGFATHDMPTDEVNLSSSSCVGTNTPGTDFFHAIDLNPSEYVKVTLDRAAPNTSLFYLFTDCANVESTCLGGRVTSTSNSTVTYTYQAGAAPERVYLGIDTSFSTSDRPVLFDIEFLTPTCTPGITLNECNADNTALVYCDAEGFPQEFVCTGGCDPLTSRCVTPTGDTCLDAEIIAASGVLTGSFANYTNRYELPITNACTSSRTPGNDAVYEVSLTAGQTLTASVISTEANPEDLAIYISDVCELLPDSCLDGSDTSLQGAETVTFTAAADETVFVIVDSFFSGLSGNFELTLTIQ